MSRDELSGAIAQEDRAQAILKVKKAIVILTSGTDRIYLDIDSPTTFPRMQHQTTATLDAEAGTGAQWVRDQLGIEPQVIDTKRSHSYEY